MWLIVEYKLLEKEDLELMKEIIEDDDIEFDLEKINEFYNEAHCKMNLQ